MKHILPTLLIALAVLAAQASTPEHKTSNYMETNVIKLTVNGGKTFTATLVDNSSTQALIELLEKGPVTIDMEDYANMEKVGPIGRTLPRNDKPTTTGPGDLILYQGRYFVIYYDNNSWDLTRLGKIDGATQAELKSTLGKGNVTVTISL